jgi:hypothetical protein
VPFLFAIVSFVSPTQEAIMEIIKVLVRVNRGGVRAAEYVRQLDRSPIRMTTDRKLALLMGRLTAEDAIKSIETSRCIPELISVSLHRS